MLNMYLFLSFLVKTRMLHIIILMIIKASKKCKFRWRLCKKLLIKLWYSQLFKLQLTSLWSALSMCHITCLHAFPKRVLINSFCWLANATLWAMRIRTFIWTERKNHPSLISFWRVHKIFPRRSKGKQSRNNFLYTIMILIDFNFAGSTT